jgi:spore maturation protein CgeB
MRILYYDWDEFNGEDCRDAMRRLGYYVDTVRLNVHGFDVTPEIENTLKEFFDKKEGAKRYYDLLFSFDYFPNISEVCNKYNMPYVSWVFDCPHYALCSRFLNNEVNRVFIFEKSLYYEMRARGYENVRYSPLGVNAQRLSGLCRSLDNETDGRIIYEHDVSFVGSLYDNEFNFYDQVISIPEELQGYIDAVIRAQENLFGVDLFTNKSIIGQEIIDELRKYFNFENTGKFNLDYDNIILDMLRKKVTVNERRRILTEMGKKVDIVLYTNPESEPIPGVPNLGRVDYLKRMPRVFHRSKVNLNITLRSIRSGVPLRVIDVLGAGGFLITNYQEEIAQYFDDGNDLVIAHTPEEMIHKTAYYLANEEERKAIAENGQKKVFEKFTYTKLLPNILEKSTI